MKWFFYLFISFLTHMPVRGQIHFLEECFVGGVTAAGRTSFALIDGQFKFKWEENYVLKDAYVFTYRYGRPIPKVFTVNNDSFIWDQESQISPELPDDENPQYFTVHGQKITDSIIIENDSLHIYMDGYDWIEKHPNQGWWSLQFVFLYTSPTINDTTCINIYIANQPQNTLQTYKFKKPNYRTSTDVGFSIYSDRLNVYYEDRTRIGINNEILGEIWGFDKTNPGAGGVRGHFYYENRELFGLDDDTANTQVYRSDGIAVINEYLNDQEQQNLYLNPVNVDIWGFNPHPAFFIVYTPNCSLPQGVMPRSQSTCRRQSPTTGQPDYTEPIQFSAIPGYDHYAWTPAAGLDDSTLANPICIADSSGWYRVRMWNDDDTVCEQTIPVFLTVGKVPRPNKLQVLPSSCPTNTGKIIFADMDGKAPFQYTVNEETKNSSTFENLSPGNYELSVQDAQGCRWDTTVTVGLTTIQTAGFRANPQSGYSPLQVVFQNESTNATSYAWQIDGVTFSTSANYTGYTFADSGTYVVSLIAYLADLTCADTAYATIRVEQGLKLIIPNIITPNNDGRNDALVVQTGGVATMRWEVHNRWGNLIHSGEALNPPKELTLWNPEENQMPDGVYTVLITANGQSGEVKNFGVQVVVSR